MPDAEETRPFLSSADSAEDMAPALPVATTGENEAGESRFMLNRSSASEAAESDSRHILIRSLGPEMFVSPDTTALTLLAGDVLVLCTDGLHDEMPEALMAQIVSQNKNMDEIARELVARAVEIDGGDNTTAQVIRVRAVEQVGMYRGRPYRLPS